MSIKSRLLGMAFASADLLFELDQGRVAFATGAGPAPGITPSEAWVGQALDGLLTPASLPRVRAALAALQPGIRSQPIEIQILLGDGRSRKARLNAFLLPEIAPFVSCSLVWEGPVVAAARPVAMLDARELLRRAAGFLAQGGTGPEVAVAFVDVPGLAGPGASNQRATARIEAHLQSISIDGQSAARLTPECFALVRDSSEIGDLAAALGTIGASEGLNLSPIATQGDLAGCEAGVAVRTLRLALEECLKDGAAAGSRFGERLKRTVQDADRFRSIVRERNFTLVYQPIVALNNGVTHHFEALARFGGATQAPTGPIAMAEELGLIEGFDLAVAETAVKQMRQPGFSLVKVAINVSGVSLGGSAYVDGLLKMTANAPEIRKRLLIEVTETATLSDIDSAARLLKALRDTGIKICLDDFGVGAGTLDYLRRLPVDIVKIDGAFVRDLNSDPKVRTLAGHLVELCQSLKIATVAEMVETEAEAATVRSLGVDYAQGWLFGRPWSTPSVQTAAPPTARRKGEVAGWG